MTPAEDLERIGRRLTPEVLRALADHLDEITTRARSDLQIHHGDGGIGVAFKGFKTLKTKRVDFPEGPAPQSAR